MTGLTPEEIEQTEEDIANLERKAAYWEQQSKVVPADEVWCCIDYAQHLRTLAELERLKLLD
jgi:hypothetical protein